jgi:dephospho-CoA kinase
MKLLGLTGGIGMGKSASATLLEKRGLPVIDTDQLARDVVQPGEPAWHELQEAYGPEAIGPDRQLRRDYLASVVFADPARRRQLEAILHPRIRERWQAAAARWREQGRTLGVVVIPLLFETGGAAEFEAIVCVACSRATQQARLEQRGWSAEQIRQRLEAQWPTEKKMDRSHYVIWTEASLDVHAAQWERILTQLQK